MPFDQFHPRSFRATTVREHAPARSGVYGITNAQEWIYIGEADNIQQMLLYHMQESSSDILERHPTGFVFELCDPATRVGRQNRLILEYNPAFHPQRQ